MHAYDTLVEALNDLNKRGYTYDFNLKENCLYCQSLDQTFTSKDFDVVEHYRFEGASDPGDLSEVYAIETGNGIKGVLTDGYGISSSLSAEMVQKLRVRL